MLSMCSISLYFFQLPLKHFWDHNNNNAIDKTDQKEGQIQDSTKKGNLHVKGIKISELFSPLSGINEEDICFVLS
jgi:hypothetical protein